MSICNLVSSLNWDQCRSSCISGFYTIGFSLCELNPTTFYRWHTSVVGDRIIAQCFMQMKTTLPSWCCGILFFKVQKDAAFQGLRETGEKIGALNVFLSINCQRRKKWGESTTYLDNFPVLGESFLGSGSFQSLELSSSHVVSNLYVWSVNESCWLWPFGNSNRPSGPLSGTSCPPRPQLDGIRTPLFLMYIDDR